MKRHEAHVGGITSLVTAAVFVVGLLVLAVRLREVQVEEADYYGYAGDRQSLRRVQTCGLRGRILARSGSETVVLADNRRSVTIALRPADFQRRTASNTVERIAQAIAEAESVIGRPSRLDRRAIARHVNQSPALTLAVWTDVDHEMLARYSEHEADLAGFECYETEERVYPYGGETAHVVGYVGRARRESEAGDVKFNYCLPEMCGRSGLELYYDSYLRGVPGERSLRVDARGFTRGTREIAAAQRGPDLRLNLDLRVQRAAALALQGLKGACVALDPRDGAVLAFVSAPAFEPNAFVPTLDAALYARYSSDPAKPLLNRASGGTYPPGSTFKPVTALAAQSVGVPSDMTYCCRGVFEYGGMRLHCASRWGHGDMDMRHALMKSCNPYFCHIGVDVGTNVLLRAARAFGLGAKTGLDFGADAAGVVPDGEWKRRVYGESWYPGDLAQMSIGQGMLLVTPLQMARVAAAIGTGYLVTPRLGERTPVERQELAFSSESLRVIRDGMRMVVAGDGDTRGTGWRGGDGVPVAVSGKTGTAEVGMGERRRKNTWFIAYAPSESPTIAIAMVVENGESGGGTTAPKVAEVLKAYFGEKEDAHG